MQQTQENVESFVGQVAARAGKLSIEVVDVAGVVDQVSGRIDQQNKEFSRLQDTASAMMVSNQSITTIATDTQMVSVSTQKDMSHSRKILTKTIEEISSMSEIVAGIAQAVERLNQALGSVANVASGIAAIARQTNLLALNATIEASRAGEAGKGFSVVAAEVKELSRRTATATAEIQSTVQELATSVAFVIDRTRICGSQAQKVRAQSLEVAEAVAHVDSAMEGILRGAQGIATTAKDIDEQCRSFVAVISAALVDVDESNENLRQARDRVLRLVEFAEDLISGTVAAGIETEDTPYINAVREGAKAIETIFESVLADGTISESDLFDANYVPVVGSDPQQFRTRFVDLTDRLLPDIQEPPLSKDSRIVFCAAVDRNGYLPTHNRKFSQLQGPDPVWNAANSRNRRIFNDRVGLAAGRNLKPILLQSYRRDMGGGVFATMKDVSAPIFVRGRHWGSLRLAYKA